MDEDVGLWNFGELNRKKFIKFLRRLKKKLLNGRVLVSLDI